VTWWAILALAAGTYVCKAAGPVALGARAVPPRVQDALTLVSVTLLAALVAISTVARSRSTRARRASSWRSLRSGCARRSRSS
jgi:uncharacterized membrane protein